VPHRMLAWILLTAAITTAGTVCSDASDVVKMRLRGRVYMEPADVRVTIAVEPHAQNRWLRIEADGEQMLRASELMLAGAQEKRTHIVEFKNLPAGHYTLRARVSSADAVRGLVTEELIVAGSR